jgi:hypothetical protein
VAQQPIQHEGAAPDQVRWVRNGLWRHVVHLDHYSIAAGRFCGPRPTRRWQMPKSRKKRVSALADLEQSKVAVLNNLTSKSGKQRTTAHECTNRSND